MRTRALSVLSVLLPLLLASCLDVGHVGPADHAAFSIYLLKDPATKVGQAAGLNLNELELAATPWLSAREISFYDFSTHCIYLKGTKSTLFPALTSGAFPADWWGKPFVVVAGGARRYLGMFNSALSSAAGGAPCIFDLENTHMYPEDVLLLSGLRIEGSIDVRNDQGVRESLEQAGLFHAGVSATLDRVQLLENSGPATIAYTFTMTNNDVDALYIVDPQQMGDGLFNYYNNGPVIVSTAGGSHYATDQSGAVAPTPFNSWSEGWFTRIPSHGSLQRTVVVPGFPHIPPGTYHAEFEFQGPVNIDKLRRALPDGRRWLGPVRSTRLTLTVQ